MRLEVERQDLSSFTISALQDTVLTVLPDHSERVTVAQRLMTPRTLSMVDVLQFPAMAAAFESLAVDYPTTSLLLFVAIPRHLAPPSRNRV